MEEQLKQLGLTNNESSIYIFLLKNGSSTTGNIIKTTSIANSRVYESLKTLENKGLVTHTVQKNGKHFQAVNPNIILEQEKERFEKIKKFIPQLENLKNQETAFTSTAIYEGFQGFKTAFQKIINDCPKGKTISIIGFSEQLHSNDSLRIFLKNMNLKSAEKKHKLRLILDTSAKKTLGKDREKEKNTLVKYMPEGYISPAAIDIFGDYVYIFLWEEKPYVFAIKNQMIAKSFQSYFDFMWNIAK